MPSDDIGRLVTEAEQWRELGATHLSLDTMKHGRKTVDDHVAALAAAATALDLQRA